MSSCEHHCYQLDASLLAHYEQHLRRMVHLTDGHYLDQCIVLPTLPLYRSLGIEVVLHGHAGELMHMDKAYNFSLDQEGWSLSNEASLENWLRRHLCAYMLDGVEGRSSPTCLAARWMPWPKCRCGNAWRNRAASTRRRSGSGTCSSPSGCGGDGYVDGQDRLGRGDAAAFMDRNL